MERRPIVNQKTMMAVILCILVAAMAAPIARADCAGNILPNASFEDGYSTRNVGEIEVANGWTPYWQDGPFAADGYDLRPEYKPEDAPSNYFVKLDEQYAIGANQWEFKIIDMLDNDSVVGHYATIKSLFHGYMNKLFSNELPKCKTVESMKDEIERIGQRINVACEKPLSFL